MPAPTEVIELVERFRTQRDAYRSGSYKEAQLRREFIDPLFAALGWDMENRSGQPEAYKDVVYEDALKMGGGTKAPDYAFRVGKDRKFFVEAKKPSVNIAEGVTAAFQLRRYAWTARLPLGILTDFEDFAIYDCRYEPTADDDASTARTSLINFEELVGAWDELEALFSRTAVLGGSLEEFAERTKRKRGTATVDDVFLREIERWRESLAQDIYLRNSELGRRDLNSAVQLIIDRLIFLRMCEDRGIEEYGRLQLIAEDASIYEALTVYFREADAKYNSGLFHFEREPSRTEPEDRLTLGLDIGNEPLNRAIERLYFPKSPYEFSVLPLEILGQVYERFLGNIIEIEDDGTIRVEQKSEVRKAGGVYYTPTEVVEYIVDQALTPLVQGKSPRQVSSLRVVDPACGSGSFLLVAYEFLLAWHRDWYVEEGTEKHSKKMYQALGGEWRLTIAERKRILLNNIFGVDIDAQAVETTKLSLLLKVLEHESAETVGQNLRLFQERALPDLGRNIKTGNSLVASDFYEYSQLALSEDLEVRINPFDWKEFPDVFVRKKSGFDAVIGNPPYVFGEYLDEYTKPYLEERYALAANQFDTYALFLEAAFRIAAQDGRVAMIVPDAVLARDLAGPTREMLLEHGLEAVYHCGLVFEAGVSAAIVVAGKNTKASSIRSDVKSGNEIVVEHACSRKRFERDEGHRLLIHTSDDEALILDALCSSGLPLGRVMSVSRGEELGKKDLASEGPIPILVGDDISAYHLRPLTRFVSRVFKDRAIYAGPKLVVVKTGARVVAALDQDGVVTMQSVYNLHRELEGLDYDALLGILNSRACRFYVAKTFTAYKLLFPQLNQTTLESIPIPKALLDANDLRNAVAQMRRLWARGATEGGPVLSDVLRRRIIAQQRTIDRLVYAAYGLTEPQVAVIEDGALTGF